uniref:Uncharacterized protein n=1 Tax=uncultured Thermoplasmata archaeon TaxID=376542 RepID=A0A871XZF3_9ARCH|nr:hypothetical protein HULAa36F11_00028 [uncultured Thermoplasmata archaeon]
MAKVVRDRGANGQGSIKFRQNLEYPRTPGQITYYPPEPSDELRQQVRKERAGGMMVYIIGVAVAFMGYFVASFFSDQLEIYAMLIPLLLILGLVFAVMFLYVGNNLYAKLSRTMPIILMICLLLLYIAALLTSVMDLVNSANENNIDGLFENLVESLLNPVFFLMTAGLMICSAGGNMLITSTKIYNEFIPGMIILETATPGQQTPFTAPAQPPINQEAQRLCSHCNKPLEFIGEYGRYYCYDCQEYAPADK